MKLADMFVPATMIAIVIVTVAWLGFLAWLVLQLMGA